MGSVSLWHWIIILGVLVIPGLIALVIILSQRRR